MAMSILDLIEEQDWDIDLFDAQYRQDGVIVDHALNREQRCEAMYEVAQSGEMLTPKQFNAVINSQYARPADHSPRAIALAEEAKSDYADMYGYTFLGSDKPNWFKGGAYGDEFYASEYLMTAASELKHRDDYNDYVIDRQARENKLNERKAKYPELFDDTPATPRMSPDEGLSL